MYFIFFFIISFLFFNYNILSIWFSFFLSLSCYLSPFFWENQFFFSNANNFLLYWSDFLLVEKNNFFLENIYYFEYTEMSNLLSNTKHSKYTDLLIENISFSSDLTTNSFYLLWLEASCSRSYLIDFYCLQQQQILLAGETSLSFYRIYNKSLQEILFYSIYLINPPNLSLYLVKVQCFCFEEILIGSHELINLPILIYLDNIILLENKLNWLNLIYLEYIALVKEI
jgi:cytochrome c oxidase assembly protein subunit 11